MNENPLVGWLSKGKPMADNPLVGWLCIPLVVAVWDWRAIRRNVPTLSFSMNSWTVLHRHRRFIAVMLWAGLGKHLFWREPRVRTITVG